MGGGRKKALLSLHLQSFEIEGVFVLAAWFVIDKRHKNPNLSTYLPKYLGSPYLLTLTKVYRMYCRPLPYYVGH